jgi:hypothetical protein
MFYLAFPLWQKEMMILDWYFKRLYVTIFVAKIRAIKDFLLCDSTMG